MKTKPNEFIKFHKALMSNAPSEYKPWYFPVIKNNKAPDGIDISKKAPYNHKGTKGNWKADWARLTFEEAVERLNKGKNVGISARENDKLVIVDIDSFERIGEMPDTLTITSRKRTGIHGFFWDEGDAKRNIPTDYGEVRASEQYVVTAGSYCYTSTEDVDNQYIPNELKETIKQDSNLGVYTVTENISPRFISLDTLPKFFKEQVNKTREDKDILKTKTIMPRGKHSALFDLNISNIVTTSPGVRDAHPLHASDTGANFSVSRDLAHCWRHLVSLNALQFLVVKSGYMSCQDAGSSHQGCGAGNSRVSGDDAAILHAWMQAKKDNLIPKDDPVPTRAMIHIAKDEGLIPKTFNKPKLPIRIYNAVIGIVEAKY